MAIERAKSDQRLCFCCELESVITSLRFLSDGAFSMAEMYKRHIEEQCEDQESIDYWNNWREEFLYVGDCLGLALEIALDMKSCLTPLLTELYEKAGISQDHKH